MTVLGSLVPPTSQEVSISRHKNSILGDALGRLLGLKAKITCAMTDKELGAHGCRKREDMVVGAGKREKVYGL